MSPLPDWQITSLCQAGMVAPFLPELVNPASLDVRLGDALLIESAESPQLVPYPLGRHTAENPYWLVPGQFVLGHTLEYVRVPNHLSVWLSLKSSRAREAIDHLLAGWIDPGFHGVITLELVNSRQLHRVPIWPGMRIGQLTFLEMAAEPRRGYAETGRYHLSETVEPSRG
jgi:dCTP deaminase